MSYEIIEKLKKEIGGFQDQTAVAEVGVVTDSGDGIVKISGLSGALSQDAWGMAVVIVRAISRTARGSCLRLRPR